ncbi:MAG: heavy-metal-associated domain-containing protein [Flavobacteriia bacterium]|nr:heavy-metal-associated domain-containing protein [Flavobacteriia bacterium]
MKNVLFILICLMGIQTSFGQEKKGKTETVVITTNPQCGDCKERIEELLNYTKGVTFAELDLVTKKITIKFKPSKISLVAIKQKISNLGYDADEVKANPDAVQKLPACCRPSGMEK